MSKSIYMGYDVEVPEEWSQSFIAVKNARADIDNSGKAPSPDIEKRLVKLSQDLDFLYHDIAQLAGLSEQLG